MVTPAQSSMIQGYVNNARGVDKTAVFDDIPAEYRPRIFDAPPTDTEWVSKPRFDAAQRIAFNEQIEGGFIEERLRNHPYAATIWPDALNTIRVVTLYDGDGPLWVDAVHFWGRDSTHGMDSWRKDGPVSAITEDGRIGYTTDRWGFVWERHPDTDAQMTGVPIAWWHEVVRCATRCAAAVAPAMRLVGWDIAVCDDDRVVVVEGNSRPLFGAWETVAPPITANPRVAAFLERCGI